MRGVTQAFLASRRNRSHGESHTPEYRAWRDAIRRCSDPKHQAWDNYGRRGIVVCDRWLGPEGFANFIEDMGRRPSPNLSLERIENSVGYNAENCMWATRVEQGINRRTTKLTPDLVQEIHGRAEHGEGSTSIARRVNMSESMVRAVRSGRTWKGSLCAPNP